MNIRVNGEPHDVNNAQTIATLLIELGYEQRFVAVALNKTCVRRGDFDTTAVRDGDDIEVLAPMAGG